MPLSHYALEGARPWSRLCFTTNSPYAFSCGSSSCCTSRGPSRVCPPHPYQLSPSAPAPRRPKRLRAGGKSPIVPCVNEVPRLSHHLVLCRPIPCLQRTDVLVPWTPRCTFVPTPLVTIVAGWGGTTWGGGVI